jgi:hypothetical protein
MHGSDVTGSDYGREVTGPISPEVPRERNELPNQLRSGVCCGRWRELAVSCRGGQGSEQFRSEQPWGVINPA